MLFLYYRRPTKIYTHQRVYVKVSENENFLYYTSPKNTPACPKMPPGCVTGGQTFFFTYLLFIYNINMLCAHDACLTLGLQTYIQFIKDG